MREKVRTNGMAASKFQLTKGYRVDFGQLARLLQAAPVAVSSATYDADTGATTRITKSDLAQVVGLSDAHIEHLCSIAVGLGLIQAVVYKLTPLGSLIAHYDSFCDDVGTLWFLHYVVASDARHTVWNRFANEFLPEHTRFSLLDLRASFDDLKAQMPPKSKHIAIETTNLLDAYTEQAFSRLAYVRADGDVFALSYREAMPPLVLAACIARFRDRHRPGATALSVEEILTAPHSPGRICLLPADRVRNALEHLRSQSGFALESRADLDQVRLTDDMPDTLWMERYYASR